MYLYHNPLSARFVAYASSQVPQHNLSTTFAYLIDKVFIAAGTGIVPPLEVSRLPIQARHTDN